MADTLLRLIILLLFISFRPISSDSVKNQEEINIADQHVNKEPAAGEPSWADPQDQAQWAENADDVKGQGKPGFFSQILSDLMAPRYDEEDFDTDVSSERSFIENQEEAPAESRDKNPVGDRDQDHGSTLPVTKQPLESIVPTFVASQYFKSVNENSLTAQTVNGDGANEKSVTPEVVFAPHVTFVKNPPSVETVHNNDEASNNIRDQNSDNINGDHLRDDQDSHRDSMGEELRTQTKSELSDEDLEHLRVKRKGLTKEKDDTPEIRDKDPVMEEAGEGPESNPEGENEFESAVAEKNQMVANDNLELTVMNTDKELDKSKMSSESEGFAKGQDNKEAMPVNGDQLAIPEMENSDATERQNDRADQQQPVAKTPSIIVANSKEESSLKESENGVELDSKTKGNIVVDLEAAGAESLENVARGMDEPVVKASERKVDLDQEKGVNFMDLEADGTESLENVANGKDESNLKGNERNVDLDQEKGGDVKDLKDERRESQQTLANSRDESGLKGNEEEVDLDQEMGDIEELRDERRESSQTVLSSKDESGLMGKEGKADLDQEKWGDVKELKDERRELQQSENKVELDQKEDSDVNYEEKNADSGTEEELAGSGVIKSYDKRVVHKDTKNLKEQEEMEVSLTDKLRKQLEEEEERERKLRIAVERKRKMEEEDRQHRLDNLRKQLDEMERSEVNSKGKTSVETPSKEQDKVQLQDTVTDEQKLKVKMEEIKMKQNRNDPTVTRVVSRVQKDSKLPLKNGNVPLKSPPRPLKNGVHQNNKQGHSNRQEKGKSNGKAIEDWKLNKERFDQEKAELQKKQLKEDREMYEKWKQEYELAEQQKVQRSEQPIQQIQVMQNPRPILRKRKVPPKDDQEIQVMQKPRPILKKPKVPPKVDQEIQVMQKPRPILKKPKVPPKVDQVSVIIPASETSIFSTWTPTPSIRNISPTKAKTIMSSTSSSAKATSNIFFSAGEVTKPSASFAENSKAATKETPTIVPSNGDESQGPIVTEPTFDPNTPVTNTTATPPPFAVFMKWFRNFHTVCYETILLYWPVVRQRTRGVLAKVGLESMFDQLCDDLAFVHPGILFATFFFGSIGILYTFWSFTFRRKRYGTRGPRLRDVMRSQDARILILEEEVKTSAAKETETIRARNQAVKEMSIYKEKLEDGQRVLGRMQKELEKSQKKYEEVNDYLEKVTKTAEDTRAEIHRKNERIAECQNQISELEKEVEAKQSDIGKLAAGLQEKQEEIQANRQNVKDLTAKIQQGDKEIENLNGLLQEAMDKKQTLQSEFDEQLLRLTELQQQYNFKCDEVEVLQDCLKQIKGIAPTEEEKEEIDSQEMEKRLEDLMNVSKAKAEARKAREERDSMVTAFEEYKKENQMLKEKVEELEEKLMTIQAAAEQASLAKREKEIELETLQRYFKSTEVDLHRKLTAEESARINTQNQLQSEQAKASTAVVDADKYRQLYLEIKEQVLEIDERSKEQLSNVEATAHKNWLDYRAALKERDALKDENDLLRRKLYDSEMRNSRPSSSASSNHMNHVDGRESPRQSPHMSGIPGHGSPVPFVPMMGHPPPPPPPMFARRHPAEMLMTPPGAPLAPSDHVTPPVPMTSTPQTAKADDGDVKNASELPPPPPPPMAGFGPRPLPPRMGMPRFPMLPPMMPSPGKGPLLRAPMPPPPSVLRGPRPPP